MRYAKGNDYSVQLVAARAIATGEEIFVSYLDTRFYPSVASFNTNKLLLLTHPLLTLYILTRHTVTKR
jgi:hypothetical protein